MRNFELDDLVRDFEKKQVNTDLFDFSNSENHSEL